MGERFSPIFGNVHIFRDCFGSDMDIVVELWMEKRNTLVLINFNFNQLVNILKPLVLKKPPIPHWQHNRDVALPS